MKKPYKSIRSGEVSALHYIREIWLSRMLIYSFAVRDLKVQYAQTYLGILWSVVQPLTGLLIFVFFFQRLMHIPLQVPYAVFAFTGMMGWFYFTQLVGQAGTSLMNNQHLIKKVSFPRLVLPLSKVVTGLVEFFISFILLVILMVLTGVSFSSKIIFLPLAVIANVVVGLSVGIWLSALTIRFRDFHHIIPYLIGFGIWLTPVFYPTTLVPKGFDLIYYFHPVANVISMYRWIFIGTPLEILKIASSLSFALILLFTGFKYFIRNEKFIAEYI